jgi:hypothetical protein
MHTLHARPALTLLLVFALAASGCGPRQAAQPPVPSIATLADDPILLSRVLERCNANPGSAASPECANARAAADRRFADEQADKARRAEEGFERAREARRRAEAAAAQAREASQKQADAYELPVEGAPSTAP